MVKPPVGSDHGNCLTVEEERRSLSPSALVETTVYLTPAQIRRLEGAATEQLRSVGSYVAALIADDLERPPRARFSQPIRRMHSC